MARYVERGGEQVCRPPTLQAAATLQGYVLDGEHARLQALVDQCLNEPSGGKLAYRAVADRVLLMVAHIGRVASLDERDRARGWVTEADVSFWVPVLTWPGGRPHLAWFVPYIFVDQPQALVIGREIWGFPKALARMPWAGPLPQGGPLTVETVAMERWDAGMPALWRPVLTLRRLDATAAGDAAAAGEAAAVDLAERWTAYDQGAAHLARALGAPAPELGLSLDWLGLLRPAVPLVFLKQFRDAADPTQACYQAVIEAPAVWTNWRGGALLAGDWELELPALASHPIAADLGLRVGRQAARLPFWVDFDFRMDRGREVWRA